MNDVNHWAVGAVLLLGAAALGLDEPPLVDAEQDGTLPADSTDGVTYEVEADGWDHVVWPPWRRAGDGDRQLPDGAF